MPLALQYFTELLYHEIRFLTSDGLLECLDVARVRIAGTIVGQCTRYLVSPKTSSFPFPVEPDCDEGEGSPLYVYLLGSARLDCRAAFHPALVDGLISGDEDSGDVGSPSASHSNALDGQAHEVRLPRLVGKCAQHGSLLVGWYGKLHKDGRDGGRTSYLRRHLCQFIHFASVSVEVLTLYSFTCILVSPGQPVSQKRNILFSKRNT